MQELNYLKDILTGASLILSGQIDFMLLFLFLLVITRVYAPFDQSLALIAEMFVSQVSADRINEIYETPIAKGAETFHPQGHDIIFDHVGFAYDKKQVLRDVSFTANAGEILGIAGISGCGQKELLEAIAGLQSVEPGSSISYLEDDGSRDELVGMNPRKIRERGVALSFVPEDRLGMGLVGDMNLPANMMLRSYTEGHVFTNRKKPRELAEEVVKQLDVVTPDVFTPVRKLSGGNVQKILVGREIAAAPNVLMTAYAVRGLDINTSYAIYDLINQQKKRGCAVIFVGEDLDVLLELCDKILVLCSGRVNGILDGGSATKEEVGLRMTNLQTEEGGAHNG